MLARMALSVLVLLAAWPALAVAQGITNASQITWTAPTTNADATPLTDLASYNVRVAGPLASASTPCPPYTPLVYLTKGTKASAVAAPAANRIEAFGTAGSKNLAGDLGLTVDGAYCGAITAVDTVLNEGAASGAVPFSRNAVAPAAPSGTTVVQ